MKKTLIALAVMAASGVSFSQSTAVISGSINGGFIDNGAVGSKLTGGSFGGGANAINIVTTEDMGGGLMGGLNSQMRFNAATGDRNSAGGGLALFHAANVYLRGGFGHISFGKVAEDSNCGFDPWGCIGTASVIAGAGGTISGLIAAGTQSNSIRYATPTIAGFSGSFQTTISTRTNERSVLNLSYAAGPLSAQFLQSKGSPNVGADVAGAAAAITDVKGQGTAISAGYNFGFARLNVFNAKTKNASSVVINDITGLTASAPMGAFTLLGAYAKDKKAAASADTKIGGGVNYALSKRTTAGFDVFKQEGVGRDTGFAARVRHNF